MKKDWVFDSILSGFWTESAVGKPMDGSSWSGKLKLFLKTWVWCETWVTLHPNWGLFVGLGYPLVSGREICSSAWRNNHVTTYYLKSWRGDPIIYPIWLPQKAWVGLKHFKNLRWCGPHHTALWGVVVLLIYQSLFLVCCLSNSDSSFHVAVQLLLFKNTYMLLFLFSNISANPAGLESRALLVIST